MRSLRPLTPAEQHRKSSSQTEMSLVDRLLAREFEFNLTLPQQLYYTIERRLSHVLLRRYPPNPATPNLLNLGCGPHIYPGWVNADDYAPKRRLRERAFRPNWALDITRPWRCADEYWDGIFTEHVIEHLTYAQAVAVFRECFRTLKQGAWIRVSVPNLSKYVMYYCGDIGEDQFHSFPERALALSFLTQMHLHKSTWDAKLMMQVLSEIGFVNAAEVSFGKGSDRRLVMDGPDKALESLYVEARKPATNRA
jgi:predicted SAM-dependent methyltransferase